MTPEARRKRIEQFERACRERGLPMTTQRRLVLEEMLVRKDHPTADQIYDSLKSRLHGLSRTTVYRILDTLVQFGIITKICHHGSAARFDPEAHQHHHLVCMHCEKIIDVETGPRSRIAWPSVRGLGFQIQDYLIHFRGICDRCRQTRAAEVPLPPPAPRHPTEKPARPVSERTRRKKENPTMRSRRKPISKGGSHD
ncbi:MAG TPA: Fur family transcriptional regulator [Phycisphaerae bacterium]|nr:Fur family transcriptional regulator [Phycisphaerae bacterium]HRY67513.1 Fur family transcriptional regulator [Phycisphaerae bacterium]HSA24900.1 Fur family transcriptional regulator [Phycisphaerae bacterium]